MFFPASKQALRKTFEMSAGHSMNSVLVMEELAANRKVFAGYMSRKHSISSPETTKSYRKKWGHRGTQIEINACGTDCLVKGSLIDVLCNDPIFARNLVQRLETEGRTFTYAILGMSEFGLSELTFKEKILSHCESDNCSLILERE